MNAYPHPLWADAPCDTGIAPDPELYYISRHGQGRDHSPLAGERSGAAGARRHACRFVRFARARGDNRPDSDIMIDVDPQAHMSVYDYVGLKEYVAGLFEGPVDVVDREGLKPYVRPAATADAVYAF